MSIVCQRLELRGVSQHVTIANISPDERSRHCLIAEIEIDPFAL